MPAILSSRSILKSYKGVTLRKTPSPEFLKDELACSVVRSLPKSSSFASLKVGSISGFTVSFKDDEGSGQLDEHVDYCSCL